MLEGNVFVRFLVRHRLVFGRRGPAFTFVGWGGAWGGILSTAIISVYGCSRSFQVIIGLLLLLLLLLLLQLHLLCIDHGFVKAFLKVLPNNLQDTK
jgi:hypothetical protein